MNGSDRRLEMLRTVALVLLALFATLAGFYLGRELLVPIAFALLFTVLLRPIVRGLERLRVPSSIGAAIVVLSALGILTAIGYGLSWPLENWMHDIPQRFEKAQARLEQIRKPIERASAALEKVEKITTGPATAPATNPASGPTTSTAADNDERAPTTEPATKQPAAPPAVPAEQVPPMLARMLGTTSSILSAIVGVVLMLYLLLASGSMFADKLVKSIATLRDKKLALQVVDDVERAVLHYMLITAMINAGQAVAVGLTLWLLGMPNPLLWAIFTFVLEFIPYLGGTIMVALLTIVGFAAFDNIGHALAAPGSYLLITTIQNNVVSPIMYGKRLKLNPVAVLLSVLFWWFIWGIGGAFIAVPIVATIKIVCDRTKSCRALGEFLGE